MLVPRRGIHAVQAGFRFDRSFKHEHRGPWLLAEGGQLIAKIEPLPLILNIVLKGLVGVEARDQQLELTLLRQEKRVGPGLRLGEVGWNSRFRPLHRVLKAGVHCFQPCCWNARLKHICEVSLD